jgi:hypothetical protein
MADQEVQALVVDNGSGMVKVCSTPASLLVSHLDRPLVDLLFPRLPQIIFRRSWLNSVANTFYITLSRLLLRGKNVASRVGAVPDLVCSI